MIQQSKLIALLATLRTPNIPSIACNVFTGVVFAATSAPIHGWHAASAVSSGICLYLCGNLLNDWHDFEWDVIHRPERALPKKNFLPSTYLLSAIIAGLVGVAAASINPFSLSIALLILGLILVYTKTHKKSSFSIIPMGACRALLPLLGYLASSGDPWCPRPINLGPILFSAALMIHVCGISLIARSETLSAKKSKTAVLYVLPIAVVITSLVPNLIGTMNSNVIMVATLPYLFWTTIAVFVSSQSRIRCVSMLLAGIPLVDWMFLAPLASHSDNSWTSIGLCILPVAFIMGKFLQKIIPAT